MEAIGIDKGHILLMSSDGTACQAIPLVSNTLAQSAFLLTFGLRYLDSLVGLLDSDVSAPVLNKILHMLFSRGVTDELFNVQGPTNRLQGLIQLFHKQK